MKLIPDNHVNITSHHQGDQMSSFHHEFLEGKKKRPAIFANLFTDALGGITDEYRQFCLFVYIRS